MATNQNCDIANGTCVPCEGGATALSLTAAQTLLAQTPGWDFADDGRAIIRKFKFKNFKQSLAFVNKLGEIAEKEGHHPDITFGWGYAEICFTTHAIKGLHQNDFIMASKVNGLENG